MGTEVADVSDADFEGRAYLSEGRFLIVSDDKIGKDHRSVFVLLRVTSIPLERSGHARSKAGRCMPISTDKKRDSTRKLNC